MHPEDALPTIKISSMKKATSGLTMLVDNIKK